MVRMNVLANALKSINNAEKCGKVKFSKVILQHNWISNPQKWVE
uniref:Uncharacterized protein n=1 Tax=Chelonoidis abingdonii TaxID=106734 RepID=A0A8C0G453_CHEAB